VSGVEVAYLTDPACPWSWAAEPQVRRIALEFGAAVRFIYVMRGLARTPADGPAVAREALEASAASGMPVDPRLWLERPPASTNPACLAVKAAGEQGRDGELLRCLREGFFLDGAPQDTADGLLAAARTVPGLDAARLAIDLRSSATVEAFGADLERVAPHVAQPGPLFLVGGAPVAPDALRDALLAAGAEPSWAAEPGVEEAVALLGRASVAELAAVCGLPVARVAMELWRLAGEWRVRPERVLAADVWRAA
jgi:predicted DsbA family dithiol-disulfide isomerase